MGTAQTAKTGTAVQPRSGEAPAMLYLVYFIYFFCGLTQCFEGVFLPEFKEFFHLTYQQQMYTVFAKNIPFLAAVLLGSYLVRIGYKTCLAMAMTLYALGTFLLIAGLQAAHYEIVLLAFFLIGTGFTSQMVAGNPLLSLLGPPQSSSSRQNLGNALGAVAQIIAPATVSLIIPAVAVSASQKLPYMQALFATLAIILLCVAVAVMLFGAKGSAEFLKPDSRQNMTPRTNIWSNSRVVFGFIVIFLVLGVEASLFSFFRNFLEHPSIAGLTSTQSQRLFTLYFALFALGRLLASWIQKRIKPSLHIAVHLIVASICLVVAILAKGILAIVAVTLIGFFVSIFFPTLFAIATENIGELIGQASGLLTLGFLGCAILPVLQGRLADSFGLQRSYFLGLLVYPIALLYVMKLRKPQQSSKPA
jgi:FHS family L-fucose permease-like MFS transporter